MLQAEMPLIRAEFFTFVRAMVSSKVTRMLNGMHTLKTDADVQGACDLLDKEVNSKFYHELKLKGLLKEFREDYDELIIGSSSGEMSALDRSAPTGLKDREVFKEMMQDIGLNKK